MSGGLEWYIALICAGMILMAAELIIPGGILGIFGGALIFCAVVLGFFIFEMPYSMLAAIGIIVGSFIVFLIWMRVLPQTSIGKSLTLAKDGQDFKATEDFRELLNQSGQAETDLRPAGIALIDGERMDVVSESDWIEKGSKIKVVQVEGNRVAVRRLESQG
jgi:membrane-bound serine protease (ClpP class)